MAWGVNVLRTEVFFDLPTYRVMGAVMTESRWGMGAVLVAVIRMVGLGINGWWKRTPIIRFVGAMLGALTWMSIAFLMFASTVDSAVRLPAGMYFYLVFFIFEGWCVLATGYDMFTNEAFGSGVLKRHVAR
jgi:hypothetical protein